MSEVPKWELGSYDSALIDPLFLTQASENCRFHFGNGCQAAINLLIFCAEGKLSLVSVNKFQKNQNFFPTPNCLPLPGNFRLPGQYAS